MKKIFKCSECKNKCVLIIHNAEKTEKEKPPCCPFDNTGFYTGYKNWIPIGFNPQKGNQHERDGNKG